MPSLLNDAQVNQEFTSSLERNIREKTWGRVRPLRVEMDDDKVVVSGNCPTFYVKQLAIQALLELMPEP